MGRYRIKKRIPRKVLKARLEAAENLINSLLQAGDADRGNVIVKPTEKQIAQVTLGAHKPTA